MDWVKDWNQLATGAKNIDSVRGMIYQVVDWIKSWIDIEKASPALQFQAAMSDFVPLARVVDTYLAGLGPPPTDEQRQKLERICDLARQTQRLNLAASIRKMLDTKPLCSQRVEPVVLVLRGKPGTGKSLASALIAQAVSKRLYGSHSVYSLPPDPNYFDGYTGQFVTVMDDLGQNPDGKDFATFCQMVSTTQFLPNMASLEDKGRPFTSNLVIASSNLPSFNPVTIADPSAVSRRINFDCTIHLSEAFSRNGVLDFERAFADTGAPAVFPFTANVPFLDLAVSFQSGRKKYNLLELVDAICDQITRKQKGTRTMQGLVMQSPSESDEDAKALSRLLSTSAAEEALTALEAGPDPVSRLAFWSKLSLGLAAITPGLVLIGVALYRLFTKESEEEEGAASESLPPRTEGPYEGKAKAKPPGALTLMEMQQPNVDMGFEASVAKKMVAPITFSVPHKPSGYTQSCLLVGGRCFLINQHTWVDEKWVSFTLRGETFVRDDPRISSVHFTHGGVPTDVVIVRLPPGNNFPNNVSKIGCSVFPSRNSKICGVSASYGSFFFAGEFLGPVSTIVSDTGTYARLVRYKVQTYKGWCGSAIIAEVPGQGKKVIAMHSAGAAGVGAGSYLSENGIIKAMRALGEPQYTTQGLMEELPPDVAVHIPRTTKLKKTPAHQLFQPDYEPAVLSKHDPRLDAGVDFDQVLWSKHVANVDTVPDVVPTYCQEYAQRVFDCLGRDNGILTIEEAVLGLPGMDAMDPHTAPGLPYSLKGKRRTDLVDFETGQVCPELRAAIQTFLSGDYSGHVYQTFLKDEIRPIAKVRAGKTRIVDVPNLAHCIVGRMLLGRFAAKFQSNPSTILGSAIGSDPDVFWTRLGSELENYRYVYDVDYSAFDSSHGTGIFDVLTRYFFTQENGFHPCVKDYLASLSTSVHAFGTRRIKLIGGLPSGCAATSLINTVINNFVIRASLALTYKEFDYDMVKVIAYGDDLLVASQYQLDFNEVARRAKRLGYTMTPANKTQIFPLVSTLSDTTFLKRKFVQTNDGLYRPVMDTDNLKAMLSYYRPGTLGEKLTSVSMLAHHSGPEVYEELLQPFRDTHAIPCHAYQQARWRALFD